MTQDRLRVFVMATQLPTVEIKHLITGLQREVEDRSVLAFMKSYLDPVNKFNREYFVKAGLKEGPVNAEV